MLGAQHSTKILPPEEVKKFGRPTFSEAKKATLAQIAQFNNLILNNRFPEEPRWGEGRLEGLNSEPCPEERSVSKERKDCVFR